MILADDEVDARCVRARGALLPGARPAVAGGQRPARRSSPRCGSSPRSSARPTSPSTSARRPGGSTATASTRSCAGSSRRWATRRSSCSRRRPSRTSSATPPGPPRSTTWTATSTTCSAQFVAGDLREPLARGDRAPGRRAARRRRPLLRAHRRPRREHRRAGALPRHRLDARARGRRPLRRPAPRRATSTEEASGDGSSRSLVAAVAGAVRRSSASTIAAGSRRRATQPTRSADDGPPACDRTASAPRWSDVRRSRLTLGVVVMRRHRAGPLPQPGGAASWRARTWACSSTTPSSGCWRRARTGEESRQSLELYGPPRVAVVVARRRRSPAAAAVATIEDVSERRRVDAVRTDFVANISHELKTPVGALAVLAEALADEDDLGVVHRLAARMVDEAHRVVPHDRRPARAVADRARRGAGAATSSTCSTSSTGAVDRARSARRGPPASRSRCSSAPTACGSSATAASSSRRSATSSRTPSSTARSAVVGAGPGPRRGRRGSS